MVGFVMLQKELAVNSFFMAEVKMSLSTEKEYG